MSRPWLGIAVLIGFISLVPRSADSTCPSGMTLAQCNAAFQNKGSAFGRSLEPAMQLRNLDLNELDDATLKRALDLLLAEKAMKEFEAEETENEEMKKRMEEEEQRRAQYERIRELLNKLLKE